MMQTIYKIKDMCCRELDKIAQRGELSSATLQQAAMLVDTIKDALTIEAMEGADANGSSYDQRPMHGRDYGGQRGMYPREGDRHDMMRRLERMADHANDPAEAEAYRRAMDNLRTL